MSRGFGVAKRKVVATRLTRPAQCWKLLSDAIITPNKELAMIQRRPILGALLISIGLVLLLLGRESAPEASITPTQELDSAAVTTPVSADSEQPRVITYTVPEEWLELECNNTVILLAADQNQLGDCDSDQSGQSLVKITNGPFVFYGFSCNYTDDEQPNRTCDRTFEDGIQTLRETDYTETTSGERLNAVTYQIHNDESYVRLEYQEASQPLSGEQLEAFESLVKSVSFLSEY